MKLNEGIRCYAPGRKPTLMSDSLSYIRILPRIHYTPLKTVVWYDEIRSEKGRFATFKECKHRTITNCYSRSCFTDQTALGNRSHKKLSFKKYEFRVNVPFFAWPVAEILELRCSWSTEDYTNQADELHERLKRHHQHADLLLGS